ncbi:hypothetical protein [Pontiella sp.]|uniref:hypothetical protein n=1 Tax=Pontiella sp. TaxID=2837462 RepID=UPI0035630EEE
MKIKFSEIERAFEYVNFGAIPGGNTALFDKATGEIYFKSDFAGIDEIPGEAYRSESTVEIPHKNDLDLGSRLVFRFVCDTFPDGYDKVREIFSRRGAYARYRDWLEYNGLLDKWYDYSSAAEETALREWCAGEGIELER